MPLDELGAGVLKTMGRMLVYIFGELILELLVKGPGYIIVKRFSAQKDDIDPDGVLVLFAGCLFWCLVGVIIYGVIHLIR